MGGSARQAKLGAGAQGKRECVKEFTRLTPPAREPLKNLGGEALARRIWQKEPSLRGANEHFLPHSTPPKRVSLFFRGSLNVPRALRVVFRQSVPGQCFDVSIFGIGRGFCRCGCGIRCKNCYGY
jgi:hypothetical protein